VDTVRGKDLVPSAKRLLRTQPKSHAGFSTWDASGLFFEMHGLAVDDRPSSRTLLLLYAADLHFRLRWDILPALEQGHTVVAAPYVETGIAVGLSFGLPRKWLTELFRFAPEPAASYWLNGTPATRLAPTAGFLEFCNSRLNGDLFEDFVSHFKSLVRRGKCETLR